MSLFVDTAGREWDLRITIGLIDPLIAVGLDLEAITEDYQSVLTKIARPRQLGKVLWAIVEKQAREKKVDVEDFLAGLDGPSIHTALMKLVESIMDFSQPPTVAKASKELLSERVNSNQNRQAENIRKAIGGGLLDGDGSLEESLELTPEDSRSEKSD